MNAAERLQLIRAKMRRGVLVGFAAPAGLFVAAHPETNIKRPKTGLIYRSEPSKKTYRAPFGVLLGPEHRRPDWVTVPNTLPPSHCAPKRGKRPNPLIRISQQLPIKLKRV